MNKDVRGYLIAVARNDDETVFYGQLIHENRLQINLETPQGQRQLKQLLIDISKYEHEQGRPMLTALAINKKDNDQGPGFYELAESFGYGKKSDLRKKGWGKSEAERVRAFWQKEENYLQLANTETKTSVTKVARLFEKLINAEEYSWAKDWKDNYLNFVDDVKKLQQAMLKQPQVSIDNTKLYLTLSEPIQSYETFMLKWLKENKNGISSRGQSVLSSDNFERIIHDRSFKTIAKLAVSNPTAKTYRLLSDWWYSNEEIANRPLLVNRAFAACLPDKLSSIVDSKKFWYVVEALTNKFGFRLDDGIEWNWFTANEQLTSWLDEQLASIVSRVSTKKLEQQIWRNIFVWLVYEKYHGKLSIPANELIRRDPPEDGYEGMPTSNTSFEGRDVDFERLTRTQKELGDAGEELVKLHEKRELEKRGMHEKIEFVRIAKPGEGYDVYSFNEKGKEKFIEVKTTTGSWRNRFYLTRHELKFMKEKQSSYCLYRVYNFDEENNSGEFFELTGAVENQVIKEPAIFEVVIKKR